MITNKDIAIKYATDVQAGSIPSCKYVKMATLRFLNDLENPLYYYNDSEVDAVITFINALYLTEQVKKKHFYLEDWQVFITASIYGIYRVADNIRKTKYAYIEMSRKNGKSQYANALAIYHLLTDVDAQVVVSANSKDQAKNVDFKKCKQFAAQLDNKKKYIKHYYNSLRYKDSELLVTASDASKLDGLNTSFAIIDELHEAPNSLMYNVIKSSMGSRQQPLLLVITTAGFDSTSFCYQLRTYCTDILSGIADDEAQFAIIFTLDDEDDYSDKSVWVKANPNLNISVYSDFIESEVNKAVNFEAERNGVLVKNFNKWLKANSEEDWIPEKYIVDAMQDISIDDFKDEYCIVGVDLSAVSDITAVSYMFQREDKTYFFNEYYIPQDSINSNVNRDMFRNAAANGHIHITSGNVVDYDRILEDILKVNDVSPIQKVSYDKWNATSFAIAATSAGLLMLPYQQTSGSMNKPIKEFQKLIMQGQVVMNKNIITKWMFGNVILKQNYMGNFLIDKSSRDKKVDGVVASLNALGALLDSPQYSFSVV
jgi:phage terminase large subunit-like protein